MFPDRIVTDRLRLDRHDAVVDARECYEYTGERRSESIAEETEGLSWSPHAHPKQTADVLDEFREGWEDGETATYAVFPREGEAGAGEYAGNTGLAIEWDRRVAVPGIWLRKPFWGRGYSGERARALAALAFERLDLAVMAVSAYPENERSVRAIGRYVGSMGGREEGLLRNRIRDDEGEVHDLRRFSVSRAEYAESIGTHDGVEFVDDVAFGGDAGA